MTGDGEPWPWDQRSPERAAPVEGLPPTVAVAVNGVNVAIGADGSLWQWNVYGTPKAVPPPDAATPAAA